MHTYFQSSSRNLYVLIELLIDCVVLFVVVKVVLPNYNLGHEHRFDSAVLYLVRL